MQPRIRGWWWKHCVSFNPHPARRPDATSAPTPPARRGWSFNPHPARRPDATGARADRHAVPGVSILIRPEDRMQRTPPSSPAPCARFQSSSGPKTGCNNARFVFRGCRLRFNPHPARRPDATHSVSTSGTQAVGFQSSSGPKTGCNAPASTPGGRPVGFNPHPARRPDATSRPREDHIVTAVSILIRPEDRMQRVLACQ